MVTASEGGEGNYGRAAKQGVDNVKKKYASPDSPTCGFLLAAIGRGWLWELHDEKMDTSLVTKIKRKTKTLISYLQYTQTKMWLLCLILQTMSWITKPTNSPPSALEQRNDTVTLSSRRNNPKGICNDKNNEEHGVKMNRQEARLTRVTRKQPKQVTVFITKIKLLI